VPPKLVATMAEPDDARQPKDREPQDQFLDEAADFWAARTGGKVSQEDARRITKNVSGFFKTLAAWAAAESRIDADNGNDAPGEDPPA
jgi:hypothetical protein